MNQRNPASVNAIRPGAVAHARVAGHFGELVQGRFGPNGPVALITLPAPPLVTEVTYQPSEAPLSAVDGDSAKALAAAHLVLARAGLSARGALGITRPAPPGLGLGSSTAEVLGAIRAVAGASMLALAPEEEAALCREAEGACDPLMWPDPVIFASRQGRVLRPLAALPCMRIVGGIAGPPQSTDPGDGAFPDQTVLFEQATQALAQGDLGALGAAATASAEANQARNPNPAWEVMCAFGQEHGAVGVVVSHTGPAIGLVLEPGRSGRRVAAALGQAGLDRVMRFGVGERNG